METDFTKTVYTSETQAHFVDPNTTKMMPAECIKNERLATFCFCGAESGATDVENTALGHNHNVFISMTYESYIKNGYYSYKCERCDDVSNDTVAPAIFVCSGYSTPENGRGGLAVTFAVDKTALNAYEALMGQSLTYGAFAVAYNNIGENDILTMDNAVKAEIDRDYGSFEMKITGFETEAQKSALLTIGAYVIDKNGKVTYLQPSTPNEGDKYAYISYNAVVNQ